MQQPLGPGSAGVLEGLDADFVGRRNRMAWPVLQHSSVAHNGSVYRAAEIVHAAADGRQSENDAEDDDVHDGRDGRHVLQSPGRFVPLLYYFELVGNHRAKVTSQTSFRLVWEVTFAR